MRFKSLLILVLAFSSFVGWGQKPNLRFTHITAVDGLSNSHIKAIVQDKQGYLWMGSEDGLNKYDGYSITIYKNAPSDDKSIISNDIIRLLEDSEGNLWIGTIKGLDLYERDNDNFIHFPEVGPLWKELYEDRNKNVWVGSENQLFFYDKKKSSFKKIKHSLLKNTISGLFEDSEGNFWLSTPDDIYILDKKTEELILQDQIPLKGTKSIFEDSKGILWFGSSTGLSIYDRAQKKLSPFSINSQTPPITSLVGSIIEDPSGKLWVGTQNQGVWILDKERGNAYQYLNIDGDPHSLSFNTVNTIYCDKSKEMWLGTYSGGVNMVTEKRFLHFRSNPLINNSLSNNNVLTLFEDSKGNIWIGTDGGGLNIFNKNDGTFKYIRHNPKDQKGLKSDVITSFIEDSKGKIWIGYWAAGLDMYDPDTKTFTHFNPDEKNKTGILTPNCVMNLYEDKGHDELWVGTMNGLYTMDRKTGDFYQHPSIGVKWEERSADILNDKEGNLWVGTWDGLNRIDKKTKKVTRFIPNLHDANSLSNEKAFVLFQDSKDRLWIGTGEGLNLYNKEKKSFKRFYQKDGLPSNVIYGILEDNSGNLWLSTSNGICKFNPDKNVAKNFNVKDGLQGNEFKRHSFLKLSSGEMLFGGSNGFNMFNPNKIHNNIFSPPVVVTDFKIFNSSVPVNTKGSPLKKHISQTKEITLSYNHSVISFDFAALNFLLPEKNEYAYKLEGFEKNWNYIGKRRTATFTNLDPGEYVFRVIASNNDGMWNNSGSSIKITILPPFWQTWWFRLLAITIIIGSAIGWYTIRISTIKKQKKELEKQVQERTNDLVEMNHELLTQKEEISAQRERIQEIYNEVKDSILAAEEIQKSILPSESFIKKYLPESFVLNKPKAVVSGDFYWFDVIDESIVIAAVDCTGHGVSGAFMSILAHNLLNQTIYTQTNLVASDVLDKLNEAVIKELHHKNEDSKTRDGMDIALCIIDKDRKTLQYAGANNPLYILRGGNLIEVKADRFPIGLIFRNRVKKYTNHSIELQEGDVIYIFSDGYADQVGGEVGEKFMYPRFRELLTKISQEKLNTQTKLLEENLEKWKKGVDQLDDIMVIGFKV